MKKFLFITFGVLLVAFAAWRIIRGPAAGDESAEGGVSRVRTAEAEIRKIDRVLSYDAAARAFNEAMIFPEVPGIVSRIVRHPGEKVNKDDPILLIDRSELGLEYAPAEVRSPVNGRVLDVLVDPGTRVSPHQPVAVAGATSVMELRIEVSPGETGHIKPGQRVRITASSLPGEEVWGKVSRLSGALNPVTRKMPVRIEADNSSGKLIPGMVCLAEITVETREIVSVPNSAVLLRDGTSGVFIVGPENTASWRPVEIILRDRNYSGISGVSEGEQAAYEGNYGLIPGSRVSVEK